ncbi:MAG: DUF2764 family protein [Gammaproteobacteria bacterium]|nr:DUF2764 family protein [Gammaproteobacteria bacterium]MBT8444749.1 DUF2764 family protein [Gammaproteobacteria bacterium]
MSDLDVKYITLMTSMPPIKSPFLARQLPISLLRLAARLRMLDEDDADLLRRIQAVTEWERIDMGTDEIAVLGAYAALLDDLQSESLRRVVRNRYELRTIVAAMRRHRLGESAPEQKAPWGAGRFVDRIRRNWTRPHFGLRRTLPWIAELRELYESNQTLDLERLMVRINWNSLVNEMRMHEFDFDAVALYVLRYDIVARWLGYSADNARRRFDLLVETGLGSHSVLAKEAA